ncbi:MAG: glycerate kinase [Anaerolineales bacterium]|nr:MAG: glycerate kinase [Anaerolineales bacterium]
MTLRILIAPAGFKESLGSDQVADCIAAGVKLVLPDAKVLKVPLVDGGEGFAKALVATTGGSLHEVEVTGPIGEPIQAHYGLLGGSGPKTVVLDMASAAGLRHVPFYGRDPLRTTTYGVGELIWAALDEAPERLLIGCGDSGTNDAGTGMAQALGVSLEDSRGRPIGRGGAELLNLKHVDMKNLDPRLEGLRIEVACNMHTLLCGAEGVARVYGPQKGASSQTVDKLDEALNHFADVVERDMGVDVRDIPGGGASGGLGAGLHVFLGAELIHYSHIVTGFQTLNEHLESTDLVITAEGTIDHKSLRGKIPSEVGKRAKQQRIPVVVIAGSIGEKADVNYEFGIDAIFGILEKPISLEQALCSTAELITRGAERLIRAVLVGRKIRP